MNLVKIKLIREEVDELLIVLDVSDIHEHGSRSVGGIGNENVLVDSAIEFVDQPCVDGSKSQVTSLVHFADLFLVLEQPQQLCDGWVGGQRKTAFFSELVASWSGLEFSHKCGRAGVGPDNGVVQCLSGLDVPDYCRFSLIGDANGLDAFYGMSVFLELLDCALDAVVYGGDNLFRIMFVPSGLVIDLAKFLESSLGSVMEK